jgi:hypothetical protein
MAWIFAVLTLVAVVSIFRQVVFHRARLIWIEDGLVIWRDAGFFSAPCSEIIGVTAGMGGKFDQLDTITLKMRDGSEKVIATDALAESCDEVVRRLRTALGLENPVSDPSFQAWHH